MCEFIATESEQDSIYIIIYCELKIALFVGRGAPVVEQ